ncbi:DnaA protein [Hoeflea marina]|uniref:DnaA protein n=1 Tax=Hoeflea marina TaxID=274592 RepID=A0A317PRX1_9HYPH|nr:DnaA regulatory inactivator HdaA [Hoeflea marina]PWW03354.1 DnaA protein [Hoeflea marina]
MPKPPRSSQIPLDFAPVPASSRDDLIVSDRLSAAVAIVDRWPDWPSPVVILTGPTGSGKSHLASIWAAKSGAVSIAASAGDADAIALASAGPVLIEDIDQTGFDEVQLFHLINAVRAHSGGMLITTRLWPAAWNVALPDLASRLKAAMTVEIGEPDDELLAQVLVKLFADRQVAADDRVISYIVARMERSLAAARHLVVRLDALALGRQSRITRSLAAEALAEMAAGNADTELS